MIKRISLGKNPPGHGFFEVLKDVKLFQRVKSITSQLRQRGYSKAVAYNTTVSGGAPELRDFNGKLRAALAAKWRAFVGLQTA